MKSAAVLVTSLLLGMSTPAKPFYKSKRFWVGEAVIVTMWTLDATSTAAGRKACPTCREHGVLGGGALATAVGMSAETGFHILGHTVLRNDPNRVWRLVGDLAIPAENLAIGLPGIVRNYGLRSQCRQTGLVCE